MTLKPSDYDRYGDIIPMACKEEKGDLISREALNFELRQQLAYHKEKAKLTTINNDKMAHSLVATGIQLALDIIDNAPTVEAFTEEYVSGAYNEGYMCGNKEAEKARPQGEWIDESRDSLLCTCCNKRVYKPFIGGFPTERSQHYYPNFCAFCGADMRKGGAE